MKKTLIASAIALAGFASFAEAHTRSWHHSHDNHHGGTHYTPTTYQASVVSVEPVYNSVPRKPRYKTVCHTQQVPIYEKRRVYQGGSYYGSGHRNPEGALAGAIIGGILGNAIADDRRKGTVVGAIGGALVGSHVGDHPHGHQGGGYTTKSVIVGYRDKEVCEQVKRNRRAKRELIGYDVAYRFRGHVYNTRLDYDPGEYVTVRIGN